MLECMILGDSIGVGISMVRKDCVSYAQGGINTTDYLKKFTSVSASTETTVISLGTNDTERVPTYENLRKLRASLHSRRVVWIVPSSQVKPKQNQIVKRLAQENNDFIIETQGVSMSQDKIHPTGTGYREISKRIP